MLPNCPPYAFMYFGVAKLGGWIVQMNPLYTHAEIESELSNSNAEIIVSLPQFYSKIAETKSKELKKIVICKIDDYLPFPLSTLYSIGPGKRATPQNMWKDEKVVYFNPKAEDIKIPEPEDINPKVDVCVVQYTGGTTGIPKGALLTHYNLVSNIYQFNEWAPPKYRGEGSVIAAIPFFHVYGMTTSLLFPIFLGDEILMIPDPRNLKLIIKAIAKGKNILFPGIPTLYHSFLRMKNMSSSKIKNVALLLSGASPLPMELEKEFTKLSNGTIIEGYGLTESSPLVCATPIDTSSRKLGTVGFPVSNTIVKCVDVDDDNKDVEIGHLGEILVQGPQIMKGYLNNEEESESTLKGGWLHTGDIGYIDEEGYIHIEDRKKDMIIAGGYNIYPREIEEFMLTIPGVNEVAVIGIADEHRGETPVALIVLKEGYELTEEDIRSKCRENLAVYKVPKQVHFIKEMPKTMVGKISKKEIKNLYISGKL